MGIISRLLTDTVTRYASTGRDVYGDQTTDAGTAVACRLERFADLVASQTGDEVRATWKFATETEFEFSDRVTVEGVSYRPVQITRASTFGNTGTIYEVVL